jgi:urease accessory protein
MTHALVAAERNTRNAAERQRDVPTTAWMRARRLLKPVRTSMLHLVQAPLATPNPALIEVGVRVDRITLAKRIWRGVAEDGREFGFELTSRMNDGDVAFQSETTRYVVRQIPESVVEISLEVAPSAAAGIGWAIGNLHLELQAEPTRLLAADEPAVRQLLDRLKVPFAQTTAVFRPGRFARGKQSFADELGPSHKH